MAHRRLTLVIVLATVQACAAPKPPPPITAPCPTCPAAARSAAPAATVKCEAATEAEDPEGAPPPSSAGDRRQGLDARAWTPAPANATTTFFREVYLGMLPRPQRRTTWTLIQSGTAVLLRAEDQIAKRPFEHLDRASTFPDAWDAPARTEYVGTASAATGAFTLTAKRSFGPHEPADLVLACARRTVSVHPALASLVEGWKRMDDSMEPASWAPPRTENVSVLSCKGEPRSFEDGLSFAKPRKETATEPELVGIEWAHVDSDMVIQQGGYRWITAFSMK